MDWKLDWRLAVCLLGPLCAGCAASQDVVRGQSPGMMPQQAMMQPVMMQSPMGQPAMGQPSMGQPAMGQPSMVYNAAYDQCEGGMPCDGPCPECGCTDGTCCHCCCLHNLPQHRLYHHYCDPHARPEKLVYPPNPTPGAVVQYPYYICKGPDDFFLQK
jgi:hypothetical protein